MAALGALKRLLQGLHSGGRIVKALSGHFPEAPPAAAPQPQAAPPAPPAAPDSARKPPALRKRLAKGLTASGKWVLGIVSAVIVGVTTAALTGAFQPPGPSSSSPSPSPAAGAPLLVAVTVGPDAGTCGYLSSWITQDLAKAPLALAGFVPRPPGGVLAAGGWISLTAQGAPGKTVVINSIAVDPASRSAPFSGDNLSPVCGGDEVVPRYFMVNLDSDSPKLTPYMGNGKNLPTFPYRVSEDDPEVFMVRFDTVTCDCRFRLAVNWSSDGRTGTLEIDDHGQPFQVSSTAPTALYCPDPTTSKWRPTPRGRPCNG